MKRRWLNLWHSHLQPGITRGSFWSLIVLFVVMIVLTGASYVLTSRAITKAGHNAASIQQLCVTSNEFRAEQIGLWEFVINLSKPPAHETPAQKQIREHGLKVFEAYLHHVFAPRVCDPGQIHATH